MMMSSLWLVLLLCSETLAFRPLRPSLFGGHCSLRIASSTPSQIEGKVEARLERVAVESGKPDGWSPSSWTSLPITQAPKYDDQTHVDAVVTQLSHRAPLVTPEETDNLQVQLAKASIGQSFVLMGGDCAEALPSMISRAHAHGDGHQDSSSAADCYDAVRETVRVMLQMSVLLALGGSVPVIKIGRMAGQYAKPRSEAQETRGGVTLPTYRGDSINAQEFSHAARRHDPQRMLHAYEHAAQTLGVVRECTREFADLPRLHVRNLECAESLPADHGLHAANLRVEEYLGFMRAIGVNTRSTAPERTQLFTAHECLLLPYEQALARLHYDSSDTYQRGGARGKGATVTADGDGKSSNRDGTGTGTCTGRWYAGSAHMLWAGERTRQADHAHLHFLSGIANPVGIKVSERCRPADLLQVLDVLNPHNVPGRVTVITRMGSAKLRAHLPGLIGAVQREGRSVVWVCDPMHGNTIKTDSGYKTRPLDHIIEEMKAFFEVHRDVGSHPGGVHLEMTGRDVTECMGGQAAGGVRPEDLQRRYETLCDPRLNGYQSLEVAVALAERLRAVRGGTL